ncbi:hypothetical protein PPERSA_10561 [Pseudocohnilembus persalinus]|uniref:Uncharacterized protein n=1 Tax=Pseudocohnilembus persalinus TaxID=266149 RepID=A0A0V0Q9C1_PSEPJ|nr:hypothetical protein PPERSA_10561 [Pseudocohnilembus persalinus]|eukprot:KRW98790.1 hypothetical protein PPERSA_10561 [Pseudocohnilembus persalinus]
MLECIQDNLNNNLAPKIAQQAVELYQKSGGGIMQTISEISSLATNSQTGNFWICVGKTMAGFGSECWSIFIQENQKNQENLESLNIDQYLTQNLQNYSEIQQDTQFNENQLQQNQYEQNINFVQLSQKEIQQFQCVAQGILNTALNIKKSDNQLFSQQLVNLKNRFKHNPEQWLEIKQIENLGCDKKTGNYWQQLTLQVAACFNTTPLEFNC